MKLFTSLFLYFFQNRTSKRNLRILGGFLLFFLALVCVFSVIFHYLMALEGRQFSWLTGFYWTLTVMSTLGFGDITFESDLGRFFSMVVLISGMGFLMMLLPFTIIEFFYAPWIKAQEAARAPRELSEKVKGHVVLTQYGAVTQALINKLKQFNYPYVLIVPELNEALRLHDEGLRVVYGGLDDPETYERIHIEHAALVAATGTDPLNTNIAFTVRGCCEKVPIIATANQRASIDILRLAGATHVYRLGEMMGQSLARRAGGDAMTHVVGKFGELLIAEATTAGTPLVGKTLRESRLRELVNVCVLGVWERGHFETPSAETVIEANTVLVLAGSKTQLERYDELFCIYNVAHAPIVIIGGGRVGRATGRALSERNIDYRIIEKQSSRVRDPSKYVLGDASELEVLKKAGIEETPTVVITTHDDDINIYLTIYCRQLRPNIRIIARAVAEKNVSSLHRAGADFVMSYASMGANTLFNLLKRGDIVMVAEGLDVFKVKTPESLAGKTILETGIRAETGCSLVAIEDGGGMKINPDPKVSLPEGGQIILVGSVENEEKFLKAFGENS